MINWFKCQHRHTKNNFKMTTRLERPIIIDYVECQDCHKILTCKVSVVEQPKPVIIPIVAPIKLIQPEPKKIEPVISIPVKEISKVETPAPEPKKTEPVLREAESVEENLNIDHDEGPFSSTPDAPRPTPKVIKPEEEDDLLKEDPQMPEKDLAIEGMSFLKESHASINRRRKILAQRRARALEALKKTGKASIKVETKSAIPFLDDAERPSKEDEYN